MMKYSHISELIYTDIVYISKSKRYKKVYFRTNSSTDNNHISKDVLLIRVLLLSINTYLQNLSKKRCIGKNLLRWSRILLLYFHGRQRLPPYMTLMSKCEKCSTISKEAARVFSTAPLIIVCNQSGGQEVCKPGRPR